jgi:hypothetical protein
MRSEGWPVPAQMGSFAWVNYIVHGMMLQHIVPDHALNLFFFFDFEFISILLDALIFFFLFLIL